MSPSGNETTDDVLLIELLRRGYDVDRLLQKQEPLQAPGKETTSRFI